MKNDLRSPSLRMSQAVLIEESDWSAFVSAVFERPYSLAQQEDGLPRGVITLSVPTGEDPADLWPCGVVSLAEWLQGFPTEARRTGKIRFYPSLYEVANELHARGLLAAGEYVIVVD